jgi:hypothetical protein
MPTPYGHADVRVMLTHPASTRPGVSRSVALYLERASDSEPIARLSLTPDQFAAVMAGSATVVTSSIPLPRLGATRPDSWFRPDDRVYPRSGGEVVTVDEVRLIGGTTDRQQFRAKGMWRHSDEYQLEPPSSRVDPRELHPGPLCTRCLTETVWDPAAGQWRHADGAVASDRSCDRGEHDVTFAPQNGPRELEVLLTATTNQFLKLPCRGRVSINEYGTDGSAISVSFRAYNPDGTLTAKVHVPDPEWVYQGCRVQPRTVPCPDPADHEV